MSDYLLDKEFIEAKDRLTIKEHIQDPATLEYFEKIGIQKDWHCLELGGGAGSITSWLCKKVGENGFVSVIDLDTRFLKKLNYNNLKIIKASISDYDLGLENFNLIHGRDVLMHIKNRDEVLKRLFNAVKSDGWILLEEPEVSVDTPDPLASENDKKLYKKITDIIYQYLQRKGLDPYYGATLLGKLRKVGFTLLHAEGRVQMYVGSADQQKSPHVMAFEQLSEDLISNEYLTKNELSDFLKLFEDNNFAWREGLTMSVWGKKKKNNV